MTVVVLARDLNPTADRLVTTLTDRGVPVFRTDLAALPQTLTVDARFGRHGWDGVLATEHREVRLSDIRSVCYRHPSHFELPDGMSATERRHASAEARCGLGGVLSSLDVLWVNHPSRESDALKPRQLDVARRCGLRVPDSQVTNRRSPHQRSQTVLTDATELTPQEEHTARSHLCHLAERLTEEGALRSAEWREVFQRTWRHPYVPRYYPDHGAAPPVSAADGEQRRAQWLATVYSDESLITKMVPTPLRKNGWFTSSSTMPSLMLTMLEALDITDGHRVLEIGTGSGYNAALLCERLGDEYVTSVDIDPELIELASARLAANGYHPTLAATDGAGGYPPGAPYDRIIATCSVPAIPTTWLEQTAPSGVIMTDVRGPLGGTVVRLTMNDNETATGRFLPHYWSFMLMRPGAEEFPPVRPQPAMASADAVHSMSDVDPALLQDDGHVGFVTQWYLLEVTFRYAHGDDGQTGIQLDAPDGSIAQAWHAKTKNGTHVQQAGPRRLWDRVEEAVTFWHQVGRPNYDRFGITATTSDQYVWYDHPDSPHRWHLRCFDHAHEVGP